MRARGLEQYLVEKCVGLLAVVAPDDLVGLVEDVEGREVLDLVGRLHREADSLRSGEQRRRRARI
jgi:hypothetical protein